MAQLFNTVNTSGLVNNLLTGLTDTMSIQLVEGLSVTATADRASWADGYLTYSITIDNTGSDAYTGVTVSDILDPALIRLVAYSVTVDGDTADYTYDSLTGELVVSPLSPFAVPAGESVVITFQVEKIAL